LGKKKGQRKSCDKYSHGNLSVRTPKKRICGNWKRKLIESKRGSETGRRSGFRLKKGTAINQAGAKEAKVEVKKKVV